MKLFDTSKRGGWAAYAHRAALVAIMAFVLFILVVPQPTHARTLSEKIGGAVAGALTGITNIFGNAIGWLAYLINYFVAAIAGIAIGIVIYVISIILQLNGNVVNTLAVQAGFNVTLAVANLGFVLGIIIIAIATILRQESYGIKKTLWKLVVAAIIVNFSLVIGGVIINFANQLTFSFMGSLPDAGGGPSVSWSGVSYPFADALAGAFAPHRGFLTGLSSYQSTATSLVKKGSASQLGSAQAGILASIFSILFVAFMLVAILIVLLVILFMFIVRYVELTVLLILMPLAWLLWIFPKTKGHFAKWWSEFIRWNLFAPIVMFFLFLAITTARLMSKDNAHGNALDPFAGVSGLDDQSASNIAVIAGISNYFGSSLNTLVGIFLQMIVIIGLVVGGMIAANKMSITGAGVAVGAVKGGGKAFGMWAAKRGGQAALNLGARIVQPKPRVAAPGQGPSSPITGGWRATIARNLRQAARSPGLKTPGAGSGFWKEAGGLGSTVWEGIKKGSGIFRQVNDWECQNCATVGLKPYIQRSIKKPIKDCPACNAMADKNKAAAAGKPWANWTQVT